MKRKHLMRSLMLTLAFSIAMICFPFAQTAQAGSTIKLTDMQNVYKRGNYVYCIVYGEPTAIYEINLKTKAKKAVLNPIRGMPKNVFKKGDYLYYMLGGNSYGGRLYRKNLKTEKIKRLSKEWIEAYTIKGKKIYYTYYTGGFSGKTAARVMKLNGKGKKKTSARLKRVVRFTNNKNYKIYSSPIYDDYGNYVKENTYLKTPKGKIYLGYNPNFN